MTIKVVDSKGRLALGNHFAGSMVIVDDSDPDRLIVTPAVAIPTREAWLYKNSKALDAVRKGLAEARSGEFADGPILKEEAKTVKHG